MPTFDEGKTPTQNVIMRKSRWGRVPPKTKYRHTPMTQEIYELLYQFRALRTNQIKMLVPHRYPTNVSERLTILQNHRFIDKTAKTKDEKNLYACDVWELTEKGRKKMAEQVKGDIPYRYVFKSGEMGMKFFFEFKHSMMVIDLLANLKAGADRHGIRMIPAEEVAEGKGDRPFEFAANYEYRTSQQVFHESVKVHPDGFFGLEYADGRKAYFIIEAEHTNPNNLDKDHRASTRASSKKKFLCYSDIKRSGAYKQLGIKNFRVLVAARTPTILKNKFDVGGELIGQSHLFSGCVVPVGGNPQPNPDLIDTPWLRVGLPPEPIYGTAVPLAKEPAQPDPA